MSKDEALKKLNELVESGMSKKTIETELGMPLNSLSGFLNGGKIMPDKWVDRIETYLNKRNSVPISEEIPRTQMVVEKEGLKIKPSVEVSSKLAEVMAKINKDYGAGTVMMLGDRSNNSVEVIPTGSMGLDIALGVGGLPRGRIVEIYGPESSGKTTLSIHVIAQAQKMGLKCMMVDAEHAFDPEYAENLGVNIDELIICQPSYGEQGLEVADRNICSGEIGLVVIDSVAALTPKAELEGEMGDSKMGLHARLMSQACRKMAASISNSNCVCIFINQLRSQIGVVYGNPEITTGGNALKFYASVRLDVRKKAVIKDGEESVGNRVLVKVVKNKVAPPFRTAEFDIVYGRGISKSGEIVDAASELGIVNKSGSWYSYNDSKLGQGREAVKELLENNPAMMAEIEAKVKAALKKD